MHIYARCRACDAAALFRGEGSAGGAAISRTGTNRAGRRWSILPARDGQKWDGRGARFDPAQNRDGAWGIADPCARRRGISGAVNRRPRRGGKRRARTTMAGFVRWPARTRGTGEPACKRRERASTNVRVLFARRGHRGARERAGMTGGGRASGMGKGDCRAMRRRGVETDSSVCREGVSDGNGRGSSARDAMSSNKGKPQRTNAMP